MVRPGIKKDYLIEGPILKAVAITLHEKRYKKVYIRDEGYGEVMVYVPSSIYRCLKLRHGTRVQVDAKFNGFWSETMHLENGTWKKLPS